MIHLLILLSLAAVNAENNLRCKGVIYEGIHYDQTVLKSNVHFSSHLTTDYASKTLYFFYDKYLALGIATLNLETLDFHSEELRDMFVTSAAIDVASKTIYLGTQSGIHRYDIQRNELSSHAVNSTTIASIFLNNGVIYFTELHTNALYTIEDGEVSLFKDLEHTKVLDFYIDKDDDMYYTNGTGLYRQRKGTTDAVYYEYSDVDYMEGLTSDMNGKVFVCLKDGVYAAVKQGDRLVKQLPVDMPNGIAFDHHNDMIYSNSTDIVRISLSKDQDCIENEVL